MKTITFAGFTATAKTNKAAMAKIEKRILARFEELQGSRVLLFITDTGATWQGVVGNYQPLRGKTAPMVMAMTARQSLHGQGSIVSVHSFPQDIEAEYEAQSALRHSFDDYPGLTDPAIPRVCCGVCYSVWLDDGKSKGCTNPACEENPALTSEWRASHRLERQRSADYRQYLETKRGEQHYTIPLTEREYNTRWNSQNGVVEVDRKLARERTHE